MSFAHGPSLTCAMCGEKFYSVSPREHHGTDCSRCGGMVIYSKAVDHRLDEFVNKTYVGDGLRRLELHANRKAS